MSSNTKDALRELVENADSSRALNTKWRNRKPEKGDFHLEGCNIDELYKNRNAFYAANEKKAEEILQELPPEKAWSSISLGWEGAVMLLLCVAIFIYYKIVGVPSRAANIVVTIITVVTVGAWFIRAIRTKQKRKNTIKEMKELHNKVLHEEFSGEEEYARVYEFATAIADYETWQEMGKHSHWKDIAAKDARSEIMGLYGALGYEPEGTYDEFVDFIGTDESGKFAVACLGTKRLSESFIRSFAEETADHDIKDGFIYALGGRDNGVPSLVSAPVKGVNIHLMDIDDVMKLVTEG